MLPASPGRVRGEYHQDGIHSCCIGGTPAEAQELQGAMLFGHAGQLSAELGLHPDSLAQGTCWEHALWMIWMWILDLPLASMWPWQISHLFSDSTRVGTKIGIIIIELTCQVIRGNLSVNVNYNYYCCCCCCCYFIVQSPSQPQVSKIKVFSFLKDVPPPEKA